ncbi:hypothetical protein JCM24511_08862 [Saitozyma sp. JCM 24511]|uniref:Inhibitor I9 domain-containing protein n=1 Tax=Saitozyma podzolica TaxID=1890683 RepID=A0A427YKC2_9TREE|nr:hypothetical protein EHS25_009834 [Saitozyma podzolica]GFZ51104.1 hypothetical protein JCM24511_08862 [Saitozyma sp. JCM 24511]
MADKKVIVKFRKSASAEDKARLLDELKGKGAEVTNEDSINSSIMPFAVLTIPSHHYDALRGDALTGDHAVVEHVEEDQEMRIQV